MRVGAARTPPHVVCARERGPTSAAAHALAHTLAVPAPEEALAPSVQPPAFLPPAHTPCGMVGATGSACSLRFAAVCATWLWDWRHCCCCGGGGDVSKAPTWRRHTQAPRYAAAPPKMGAMSGAFRPKGPPLLKHAIRSEQGPCLGGLEVCVCLGVTAIRTPLLLRGRPCGCGAVGDKGRAQARRNRGCDVSCLPRRVFFFESTCREAKLRLACNR